MSIWRLQRFAVIAAAFLLIAGCRKTAPVEEVSAPAVGVAEASPIDVSPEDWAWWRGPHRNATRPEMTVPTEFGSGQNVLWKSPVPSSVSGKCFWAVGGAGTKTKILATG
jgi:hypothetical protein